MPESASILVGKKPTINYVMTCLTLFYSGAKEVCIKARGRAINRAVNVAEALRRRFLSDVKIKSIKIGTEQLQPKDRPTPVNVSTIEITLTR